MDMYKKYLFRKIVWLYLIILYTEELCIEIIPILIDQILLTSY